MSSMIEKMYYDNIRNIMEYSQDSQYARADRLTNRCLEKLTAVLNDSQKELFEKFNDAHNVLVLL